MNHLDFSDFVKSSIHDYESYRGFVKMNDGDFIDLLKRSSSVGTSCISCHTKLGPKLHHSNKISDPDCNNSKILFLYKCKVFSTTTKI